MLSLLRDFIRDFARAYLDEKIQEKLMNLGISVILQFKF